jgi:hypothetical protein
MEAVLLRRDKDLRGKYLGLFEDCARYLPGETEENHENSA